MPKIGSLWTAPVLLLLACGGESDPAGLGDALTPSEPDSAVEEVLLESPVVMLWGAGATSRLTASVLDGRGESIPDMAITWMSLDSSVAMVTDGVAMAMGDGWTEIGASAAGHSDLASIVVVTDDGPQDRTDCMVCHADAYVGRHGGSDTPETCLQCHTGPTWSGADFDHASAANGFQLLGAHSSLSCAACHETDGSPRYPGVADDECIACHRADYDGQHDPGFPTTCLQCHTRDEWSGADFDHASAANGFELLGAHSSLSCAACHETDGSPRYSGVADDECIACHQADYDGQHDPGFPTTCLQCHTRDEWSGADFDHDAQYFPILSGRHSGRWGGCSTCHVDSSDYTNFSCFACHSHSQNRMNNEHSEISGYAYDSARCYACHPRGEAD